MDQQALEIYIRAFRQQLSALRSSARWRVGHKFIRTIEFLLGRRPKSLAIDHLDAMTTTLLELLQRENVSSVDQDCFPNLADMHLLHASTSKPLSCTLVVSNNNIGNAVQGDVFTALELANALEKGLGWTCSFIDHNTNDFTQTDVVISLLHEFDIRPLHAQGIKIAWVRSYAEYWIMKPWFASFDFVLCSSKKILSFIQAVSDKPAFLFPIATNVDRFREGKFKEELASDYCFTGNYWNHDRKVAEWLDPESIEGSFKVFGNNWGKHPKYAANDAGHAAYEEIPNVYASTTLVLDDANDSTLKWNSINSRVFDVFGMGKFILSNNKEGLFNLFKTKLPTYSSASELNNTIQKFLSEPEQYSDVLSEIRNEILSEHTYDVRARQLGSILELTHGTKLTIAIKIAVAEANDVIQWGDFHFALSLKVAFEAWGHQVRIDILPHWYETTDDDVNIVLRGLRPFNPVGKGIHLMWLISHPEDVHTKELNRYDHVFVASESYTRELQQLTTTPVSTLLQATNVKALRSSTDSMTIPSHPALYIANARNTLRHAIALAQEANVELQVYGREWEDLIKNDWVRGAYIPNIDIPLYYQKANLVVVDHWEDMRTKGFISNRVFDVLASGGHVLCEAMDGLDTLGSKGISTYTNVQEFKNAFATPSPSRLSPDERRVFIEKHGFQRRVIELLNVIHPLIKNRIKGPITQK